MKYQIIKITAKEMQKKYCGVNGGTITGSHYAILEVGKGLVSLDHKMPYILKGKSGLAAMQSIIEQGGFVGAVHYVDSI